FGQGGSGRGGTLPPGGRGGATAAARGADGGAQGDRDAAAPAAPGAGLAPPSTGAGGVRAGSRPGGRFPPEARGLRRPPDRARAGARSVWRINGVPERLMNVEVTQTVEVVPGEQSARLDTALIRYTLTNLGKTPHTVGIRFLLDTYIGENDGVPFTIPGRAGL